MQYAAGKLEFSGCFRMWNFVARRSVGFIGAAMFCAALAACSGAGKSALAPPTAVPQSAGTLASGAREMNGTFPPAQNPGTAPTVPMSTAGQPVATWLATSAHGRMPKGTLTYTQLSGLASQATIAADGSLWVLSTSPTGPAKYIYHYVNGTWTNLPGLATRLALGPDSTPWVIGASGSIYHYSNGVFQQYGGSASEITLDTAGRVYVLASGTGADRPIFYLVSTSGTSYQQIAGAAAHIAAADRFYASTSTGAIYESPLVTATSSSASYTACPGAASRVVPLAGGIFLALGFPLDTVNGSAVYQFTPSAATCASGTYAGVGGAGIDFSATTSTFIALSASGGIYSAPLSIPTPVQTIAPTPTPVPIVAGTTAPSISAMTGNSTVINGTLNAGASATYVSYSRNMTPTNSAGTLSVAEGTAATTQSAFRSPADALIAPSTATTVSANGLPLSEPNFEPVVQRIRATLVAGRAPTTSFRRTRSLPTAVGSVGSIYVSNGATYKTVPSVFALQTAHTNIWIDQTLTTLTAASDAIAAIGADAENAYASDTAHYGAPEYAANAPGIAGSYQACDASGVTITGLRAPSFIPPTDGRTNIEIVNTSAFGASVGGYFTALNYIPQAAINCSNSAASASPAYSNEAPFIFVGYTPTNPQSFELGEDLVRGTAHELQHLINFVNRSIDLPGTANEATYINEGFSMLSQDFAVARMYSSTTNDAYDAVARAKTYLSAPQNVSIVGFFGADPGLSVASGCSACYGGAYLFQRYLYDRFGGDAYLRAMYASGQTGATELAQVTKVPADQLFGDFAVTLAVSNTPLGAPPYVMPGLNLRATYADQFGVANRTTLKGPSLVTTTPLAIGATLGYQQYYGSIAYYAATTAPSGNIGIQTSYTSGGTFGPGGYLIQL